MWGKKEYISDTEEGQRGVISLGGKKSLCPVLVPAARVLQFSTIFGTTVLQRELSETSNIKLCLVSVCFWL